VRENVITALLHKSIESLTQCSTSKTNHKVNQILSDYQRASLGLRLEDNAGNETGQAKNDCGACIDRRGTTRWLGSSSAAASGRSRDTDNAGSVGGGGDSRAGARAGTRRSERDGNTETRFIGSFHVGSKVREGLITSGGRVDGTVHAALAVRGAATEEPDGSIRLSDLQRVHTDLTRSSVEGNEAGAKAVLLGSSIELP